jgi:hypothetical protein
MERFCGVLKGSLHSRSQPWGNLNKRLLLIAYLEQLAARYDLEDELRIADGFKVSNELSRFERDFVGCKSFTDTLRTELIGGII